MGNKSGVNYGQWVAPMNEAMAKFGINTPKRVAAFLTQVRVESKLLSATEEDTNWISAIRIVGNFRSASEAIIQQYLRSTPDQRADYAFSNRYGNKQGPSSFRVELAIDNT